MKSLRTWTCIIGAFALLGLLSGSVAAQQVSAMTKINTPELTVGDIFTVDLTVNMQNRLSVGGYLFLQYDPGVFACQNVSTAGLFGPAESGQCDLIQPGTVRIRSLTKRFREALSLSGEQTLATVTFTVLAPAPGAAIRIADSSQLFGSGMVNILAKRNDTQTAMLSISMNSFDEELLGNDLGEPEYAWDTSGVQPEYPAIGQLATLSGTGSSGGSLPSNALSPFDVPEPGTLLLLSLGLVGLTGVLLRHMSKSLKRRAVKTFIWLIILSLPLLGIETVYAAPVDYTWTDQTSSVVGPPPSARERHSMAYIDNSKALLFGGNDGGILGDTWLYTYNNGADQSTWTQPGPVPPPARQYHAMAYIGGDQVLLFGGDDDGAVPHLGDTWSYDLSSSTWTARAGGPPNRIWHAMAYIGDDKVLLFGGYDGGSVLNDTWIYDLSDNTWTARAGGPPNRVWHAMAYIGGDQVLLFGGSSDGLGMLGDTWVYDLSDNTWTNQTPAASPSARWNPTMAYISGDQVLLFGGDDGALQNDTWIYDFSDNIWTAQAAAPGALTGRRYHAAARLDNGRVLLFGGNDGVRKNDTWVAYPKIDLGGSTENWTPIYKADNHDYFNDEQASGAENDLIGDANHPDLYIKYSDRGTPEENNDAVGFRIRFSGSEAPAGYSGRVFLGVDANFDDDIDTFISTTNTEVAMYDPGNKANLSPNTSSVQLANMAPLPAINPIPTDATNFAFVAVTAVTDPSAISTDLDTDSGVDYFVDFIMPFQNIKDMLNTRHTEPNGTNNPADVVPIPITRDSLIRFVMLTSTQDNSINGDISGIKGGVNSDILWEDLEVFTPPFAFSNLPPRITSDGGGDTTAIIITDGATAVTTVVAEDPEAATISYTISGGADAALFTINGSTGALAFLAAPVFDPNNGANNQYNVEVQADDSEAAANTDTQMLTVVVTSAIGPGSQPPVTQALDASLTMTSPLMGDLNGDGALEIVFSDGVNLSAIEGGALRTIAAATQFSAVPVLADQNGNGDYEVYGVTTDGKLHGLDCTAAFPCANIAGNFPINLAGGSLNIVNVSALASPAVGDLDGDGVFEIAVSGDDGNAATPTAYLGAWELDGSAGVAGVKEQEIQTLAAPVGSFNVEVDPNKGPRTTALAVANVDGAVNPAQEIFVGYNRMNSPAVGDTTGEIAKYEWGAAPNLEATFRLPDNVRIGSGGTFGLLNSAPSLGDIRSGGGWEGMEVVIGGSNGRVYIASADDLGAVNMTVNFDTGSAAPLSSSPTISDLNDDGVLDVIVANTEGKVYAFYWNGAVFAELPGWEGGLSTGWQPAISPTVGDVDSDDALEVVTAQMNTGRMIIINANGTYDGTIINATGTTEAINGTVAIGDLDRDGDYELVTTDESPLLYNWDAADGVVPVSTIISWNYHRGNAHRSGSITTVDFNPIQAYSINWNPATRVWNFDIEFENTGTGPANYTGVRFIGYQSCVTVNNAVGTQYDNDHATPTAAPATIAAGATAWFGHFEVDMSGCAAGNNRLMMYFDITFEDQWGSEYLIHR